MRSTKIAWEECSRKYTRKPKYLAPRHVRIKKIVNVYFCAIINSAVEMTVAGHHCFNWIMKKNPLQSSTSPGYPVSKTTKVHLFLRIREGFLYTLNCVQLYLLYGKFAVLPFGQDGALLSATRPFGARHQLARSCNCRHALLCTLSLVEIKGVKVSEFV